MTASCLELGADHPEYGQYSLGRLSDRTVWAISVGADRESPSLQYKGNLEYRNEDGLLAIEQGDRILLAVADGHFGREASHLLLTDLAGIGGIPSDIRALENVFTEFSEREPTTGIESATSLIVSVFDRRTAMGFGMSFGDSTLARIDASGHCQFGEHSMETFVSPKIPSTLAPGNASVFSFAAEPGAVLLAYTDGIDECHYREPATSVTPELMATLFARSSDVEDFVSRLVGQALEGVDGNPGGQDNIAVVATVV